MKENFKKLVRYIYVYKIYGFWLFAQVYWFKKSKINLKQYCSLYIRTGSFDAEIFTQMFIYQQYDFNAEGRINTIIDLGANNGMSAIFFSKKYPDAIVYALEPDNSNFEILLKNTAHLKNVVPLKLAIWKKDGWVSLDSGDSWTVKVDMENGKNIVESITMDTLISRYNIKQIDLLKVDIEGAEKELFENSFSFLSNTKNLAIELHDWLRPGTAKSFFLALTGYTYQYSTRGENTIITNIEVV